MQKNSLPVLSIIILTYNTKEITLAAVKSIEENYKEEVKAGKFEVIVADNSSTDGSLEFFRKYKDSTNIKIFHIIDNEGNLGFSKGNNKGVLLAKGKYVLFLNPDTIVYKNTLNYMLDFMDKNSEIGASSCKLINQDGQIDFNCHRGFPTPWNAFCYFLGLQRLFPKNRLFAGYTQGWKNLDTTHEVDAIEGAFMLVPKSVGEKVGWWDEDYFFYGEDLQFCYNIKKIGLKIYYVGEVNIMHIGGAASGIKKKTQNITTVNMDDKKKLQVARFDAMKIFYSKNYKDIYPKWVYFLINKGIDFLKQKELTKLSVRI